MEQSQTIGIILLGMVNAFRRIDVITSAEASKLTRDIDPDQWYPLPRFFALMDALTAGGRDVSPVLFRAGTEFITMWYHDGPGHTFIDGGIDFLRYQAGSSGYSSVVRGPREEVGAVELVELDEPAGLARILSITPFPSEFDRGAFYGGVVAPGDMAWVEVVAEQGSEGRLNRNDVTIRFRVRESEERRRRLDELLGGYPADRDPAVPGDLVGPLYWRHRDLVLRHENNRSFFDCVSKILSETSAELSNSEQRLASVLNSMDDLVFMLDREGRFLDSCQSERDPDLFAPPQAWVGKAYSEVLPPPITDKFRSAIDSVREPGEKQTIDYALPIGGEEKWFSANISPRMAKGGALDGHTVVVRNITARKRMEDEQRRARDAAEAASRAKSTLLANTSHEVRTPMNAIIGLTELALRCESSPKVRDYLSKIQASSRSLLGILNDILDFSRMEAEKVTLEMACVDLRELLQEISSGFDSSALRRGIDLEVSIDDGVPQLLVADPLRLRQVLTNLVNNAIKFTPQGSVAISARLVDAAPRRATIELAVQDSGIGIPSELFPLLFEPFRQADGSTTRRFGGSGLGLAICKRLVELMGGDIVVESTVGEGSRFAFTLVLDEPDDATALAGPAPTRIDADSRRRLRGARVLVVEDNETNQQVARELLESAGVRVEIARDGREALDAVVAAPFDAVLMDVQMPEMDGLEATRRIRELPQLKNLPIIAMTAHAMRGDHEKSLDAGMNAHVTKPIDSRELLATLAAFLPPAGRAARQSDSKAETLDLSPGGGDRPALPEDLPGINVQAALERVGGKPAALRSVLASFHRSFADSGAAIRRAVQNAETDEARRLAHGVKGVAGNISADALYQAAIALEAAIGRGEADTLDDCLGSFDRALEQIVTACAAFTQPDATPAEDGAPAASRPAAAGELRPQLEKLAEQLRENRSAAIALFRSLRDRLLGLGLSDLTDQLGAQIERLDFEAGMRTLRRVLSALNRP